jgi:hypothetical protein
MKKITFLLFSSSAAQEKNNQSRSKQQGKYDTNKFSQMYDLLATPNMFRNAAEHQDPYYQQQADYKIDIELDDKKLKINWC